MLSQRDELSKKKYVYFWVDGIYITELHEGDMDAIDSIIPDYNYKIEHLRKFNLTRDRHIVNMTFEKVGSGKQKTFSVSDKDLVLINSYIDTSFMSSVTEGEIKKISRYEKKLAKDK